MRFASPLVEITLRARASLVVLCIISTSPIAISFNVATRSSLALQDRIVLNIVPFLCLKWGWYVFVAVIHIIVGIEHDRVNSLCVVKTIRLQYAERILMARFVGRKFLIQFQVVECKCWLHLLPHTCQHP